MRVLKTAIEFDQTDIRDKCVGLIARHFQAGLDDEAISLDDFNWIPLRDFQAILSHPLLAVKEEYTVYRLIRGYGLGSRPVATAWRPRNVCCRF